MTRTIIETKDAPAAIGTYVQAVKTNNTVYLSGQIGLLPSTMELVEGVEAQIHQVFKNLSAVCQAAGGELKNLVKINIYLTDLGHFALLNQIMEQYFTPPYPARAALGVASLPRGAQVEMDGIAIVE